MRLDHLLYRDTPPSGPPTGTEGQSQVDRYFSEVPRPFPALLTTLRRSSCRATIGAATSTEGGPCVRRSPPGPVDVLRNWKNHKMLCLPSPENHNRLWFGAIVQHV